MTLRSLLPETIDTPRLVLRTPRLSDLDDLTGKANNWSVLQYTGLPYPYEAQHGRAFVEKTVRTSHHPYVIAEGTTDHLLGVIGLYAHDDAPVELGYWLGEAHWGQGLASEAIIGLLDAARSLAPIRAKVVDGNNASIRVLEKSGFAVVEHTTSTLLRHFGKPLTVLEWRG